MSEYENEKRGIDPSMWKTVFKKYYGRADEWPLPLKAPNFQPLKAFKLARKTLTLEFIHLQA